MITKAELDKMVEERAEYYATNEGATIEKIEAFTVDKHLGNPQQYEYVKRYNNDSFCSFKSGASFVTGILQDEIDELKRSNVNLFDTVCDFERGIECLQSDRTKLENQLSEANATIQSLKDENGRIREALGLFKKELTIGSDGTNLKCTCSRENCHSLWLSAGDIIYRVSYVHSEKLKALTQKAEE